MYKACSVIRTISVGGLLIVANVSFAHEFLRITDIRYWSAPDHTRIVVDGNQPITYKTMVLKDPHRIVVDIENATAAVNRDPREVGDSVIHRIRISQFNQKTVRLVIDLVKESQAHVFTLNKHLDKPYRLVIDLDRNDLVEKEKKERLNQRSKEKRIIVLDPGHGGEDVGAIGFRGTYEKTVVLALAKKVKEYIDQQKGYRAFLTREGDYFIPLRKRVEIAREYGADIFVSLHTDANFNKEIRGASVYCLSLKGSSDEAAKLLAERENASDLFGGVSYASNKDLNFILIDLVQTQTINDSLKFGGMVLNTLEGIQSVKFKQPKQAGFAVLRAPEIPSILIETGFITNPTDERLLSNESFQHTLARAIASVSCQYLDVLARRNGTTAQSTEMVPRGKGNVHLVKPHETLWQIARKYNTTVDELIELNNLARPDDIKTGRHLTLP